ncbi:MAG: 4-demethylwyosine synthase TYW1 [Nanoarchaeota archaeon]
MDEEHKRTLERQHNYITGNHSAVKVCTWTKKSLKGEGVCYKQKFYGIKSHRCCQMSPAVGFCPNKCVFCWRPMEYTNTDEIKEPDEPEEVIENSVYGQKRLLTGLGGYEGLDKEKFREAQEPMHFAISLTGEPMMYPKLGELMNSLHKKGKSTFLVSNGVFPERLKSLKVMPTQLYISVDAPSRELYNEIVAPAIDDSWEKLMHTLEFISTLNNETRTTLRLTMIKNLNMTDAKGWGKLIQKASPLFVEVKAYMFVGYSRQRLSIENMPRHFEIKEFAQKIAESSGYKIIDEKEESRVVLLMKEDFKGRIMSYDI